MRVEVEVVATRLVNHAMAFSGVGVLRRVTAAFPDATGPVDDVLVTAELLDADGTVLSRPWQHLREVVPGGERLVLEAPPVVLDTVATGRIEEERPGELVVRVQVGDCDPVTTRVPVRVLAARQWLVEPDAVLRSVELLAAFVQPNHPAVGALTRPVADRLLKRTGSASLGVADVEPQRVDAIVEAAFATVHDLGISYAEPPASWGYGQKVRDPGEVLGHRIGTCLDTTLTLAALLEHLGVGVTLWIARGHAFLGYWRRGGLGLPDAASLHPAAAVNAVDLGLVGLLETTFLTRERRPPGDLFRRATQAPLDRYVRGGTADLLGVVDVAMARLLRLLPLPARTVREDGVTEVVEYHPATPDAAPTGVPGNDGDAALQAGARTPPATGHRSHAARRAPVPARVQAWKHALLDLSLRNPLLNLGRGISQLPLLMPHEQLGTFADLLQDGRSVAVRAADDLAAAVLAQDARSVTALPADVRRDLLAQRRTVFSAAAGPDHRRVVERLRYRARTALQETGANLLYVTLGRLDWTLDDRPLSAPLLLAPVQITGVLPPYRIVFDPAGQVTLNLSLVEKLRLEFGFTVPGLHELPRRADGEGVDVAAAVRTFREALAAAELPFRVDGEARMAIIAFTGYLLWRDLDEHWETFLERPLFRRLALAGAQPPDEDGDLAESGTDLDAVASVAPIPADGSQAEAIAAARTGRSFVLEGPPGTGKSQTITNILADQLASGRTVLFVAEKGAALDVVRSRLDRAGLSPLTLDLHDDQAGPSQVRRQLRAALALRPQPDRDAYRVAAADVATGAATLRDYARRLHEPNAAGLSLYGARGLQLARGTGPSLTVPAHAPGSREAVADAVPHLSVLGPAPDAWGFAHDVPDGPPDGAGGWWPLVEAADAAVARAAHRVAADPDGCPPDAAQALLDAGDADDLAARAWLLGPDAADVAALREVGTARWQQARDELAQRTDQLRRQAAPVLARFAPDVAAPSLRDRLTVARQALREAEASFFLGRGRRLVAAAAPLLAHLLAGARVPPKQLPAAAEQVAAVAEECAAVSAGWRALPGCAGLPTDLNVLAPAGAQVLAATLAALERDAALFATLPWDAAALVVKARDAGAVLGPELLAALDGATGALRTVLEACGARAADQRRWSDGVGLLRRWATTATARAADAPAGSQLRRWAAAVRALSPLEGTAEDARWQLLSGVVTAGDAVGALERGLAAASVAERLDTQGLACFDAESHDRTVDRFVEASGDLRDTLRGVLPAAVVERRPFRPGRLFGTVAALEREVNRSRGGLSVRRLLEQFGAVVAEVTPCLLVSPDSLARFVPPGAMVFDLVVFDEASQISVADAVGALGRARAAVIAGDSKQLPPTAFAQLGSRDDEPAELAPPAPSDLPEGASAEDYVVLPDEESILSEAVTAGLPRLWLSWHYRSQDESLIAFSNAEYYEGRLLTFPAVPGRDLDAGVSFTRVPGQFLRSARSGDGLLRTNPVEAAAVVEEVLRRWRAGERSLGVVTFNVQQRALVESMLVESGEPGVAESLDSRQEGIFVKNLENVQGDERDVVLFSTGFSTGANGVLPLNFGPLNRSGGERRLNVAVTRARRRVMVFSSFEPQDVRADQTSSVGVKHLRAYLELAKYGPDGATGLPAVTTAGPTVDRHRDELASRLRERGLQVSTSLGLSDFQVDVAACAPDASAGSAPVLAILLDSPAWSRRRTTGDRDGLGPTVLAGTMGWPAVTRVWLPRWLQAPETVLDELVDLARAAASVPVRRGDGIAVRSGADVETPPGPTPEAGPEPSGAIGADPVGLAGDAPLATPFVAFQAQQAGAPSRLAALAAGRPAPDVVTTIRRVVDAEGPIAPARLARHVGRCFGVTRLQRARQVDILRSLPPDLLRDAEGFVWPAALHPDRWRGYRTFPGPLRERPLEEVAVAELANALEDLARRAMGIPVPDLLREAGRVFGAARLSETGRARLTAVLDAAVAAERLAVTAGVVRAPG